MFIFFTGNLPVGRLHIICVAGHKMGPVYGGLAEAGRIETLLAIRAIIGGTLQDIADYAIEDLGEWLLYDLKDLRIRYRKSFK